MRGRAASSGAGRTLPNLTRIERLEGRVLLSTFTVTNVNDTGAGSLRQAILSANASPGADVIEFDIAGASKLIRVASALPAITQDLLIDGTSQDGYAGKPLVELTGGLIAAANTPGLRITGGAVTIKGLAITAFSGDGIVITSPQGATIQANHIGIDATGRRARGNGGNGIFINGSPNNLIGGSEAGEGNIIAFNGTKLTDAAGVLIAGNTAVNNRIQRNSIFNNRRLGIDIARSGTAPDLINPADVGDADSGPNNLQNQPFMTSATVTISSTRIIGSMRGAPNQTYHIEFYGNDPVSGGPSVQAKTFLGAGNFTADASGNVTIDWTGPTSTSQLYTAIATDASGNTSEISLAALGSAGIISGTVWDDLDLDGIRDAGEPLMAGRGVYIDKNNDGRFTLGEPTVLTDSKGTYKLPDQPPGRVVVRVVPAPGRRLIAPRGGYYVLNLPASKTKGRDFGFTTTIMIGGTVYNDANGNGQRDSGEAGLAGFRAFIDGDRDGILDSNEFQLDTDSLGNFRWAGLFAGTYYVRIAPRAGYSFTAPLPPVIKVVLGSGQTKTRLLFGVRAV